MRFQSRVRTERESACATPLYYGQLQVFVYYGQLQVFGWLAQEGFQELTLCE